MALQWVKGLSQLKVKQVPPYLKSTLTRDNIVSGTRSWLDNYNTKYVQTGSIKPLNDVLISVFLLSYAVGWPTEIRHLRHQEHEKHH
ncbi:hypothetical protein O6H91_05G106800 [Diphasiastrum complanatum]|uniref:Uncharacterized protein n=2 Tax=Diphasiastrum complanatum TaxID=34168 RepID=A0ACC2DRR5_DIPCM|nr:hypothetical protein O6H91_05G061700 [Diphasiastrum complanatum]KAJ7556976.1 hypothetical protein O6H91_05G106800 [Diphasiastrum complanatum]